MPYNVWTELSWASTEHRFQHEQEHIKHTHTHTPCDIFKTNSTVKYTCYDGEIIISYGEIIVVAHFYSWADISTGYCACRLSMKYHLMPIYFVAFIRWLEKSITINYNSIMWFMKTLNRFVICSVLKIMGNHRRSQWSVVCS